MKVRGFRGGASWEKTVPVKAAPNGSSMVFSVPLDILLEGARPSSSVFSAEFFCPGEDPPRALRYFALPKDMALPLTEVKASARGGNGAVTLRLTSAVLAKDVFLDLQGAHFSDNFFDILPGDTIEVTVSTGLPAPDVEDRLTIKTLKDTY
jgi:beta-mannosidase